MAKTEDRQQHRSFSTEEIAIIRRLMPRGATEEDLQLLLSFSQKTGLDPILRQVWVNKRDTGPAQPIATIDGLRTIAIRSGEYQGQTKPEWCDRDGTFRDVWTQDTPPAAARVGVYRKGFQEPVYGVARYQDYVVVTNGHPNFMWQKMAAAQTLKCAESLALRKAFPELLSGVYSDDEMAQVTNDSPVIPFPRVEREELPQVASGGGSRPANRPLEARAAAPAHAVVPAPKAAAPAPVAAATPAPKAQAPAPVATPAPKVATPAPVAAAKAQAPAPVASAAPAPKAETAAPAHVATPAPKVETTAVVATSTPKVATPAPVPAAKAQTSAPAAVTPTPAPVAAPAPKVEVPAPVATEKPTTPAPKANPAGQKMPAHSTDAAAVSALLDPVRRKAKELGVLPKIGAVFQARYGHLSREASEDEALDFATVALDAPDSDPEAWLTHLQTAKARA